MSRSEDQVEAIVKELKDAIARLEKALEERERENAESSADEG